MTNIDEKAKELLKELEEAVDPKVYEQVVKFLSDKAKKEKAND